MTELEKIERAKMYMDKLANGINPIDDTMAPDDDLINNVRLPRSNGSVIFAPLVISVVFIRPIKLHCWKHGPSIRIGVLFWTI